VNFVTGTTPYQTYFVMLDDLLVAYDPSNFDEVFMNVRQVTKDVWHPIFIPASSINAPTLFAAENLSPIAADTPVRICAIALCRSSSVKRDRS